MFFKTFTIDGLNFGNKFTVLFDADYEFMNEKRYDGENIFKYVKKIKYKKDKTLMNSLVDHIMNITIEQDLEPNEKTEVYNYLLKLLNSDTEGFQKLLLDSCNSSICKTYRYNTLDDYDNIINKNLTILKEHFPSRIETFKYFHITTVYITCGSIDEYYNELMYHHLNKIKKFLYSKDIENVNTD